jgi:hypothetical protein
MDPVPEQRGMNDSSGNPGDSRADWSPRAGSHAPRTAERSRRRWSWRLSRWVHGALIGLVGAEFLLGVPLSPLVPDRAGSEQIELVAVGRVLPGPPPLVTIPELEDRRQTAAQIAAEEIVRQAQAATPPELERQLLDPAASPTPVAAEWVQRRMLDELAAAEKLSTSQQQERLAQLAGQLERISSAESVAAISSKLAGLLGSAPRATQPAAGPVGGAFDHESAQLHDVKRSENLAGGYDYIAVLLDSSGRTLESALSQAEGEQLYKTFQIIKANPLLERVYRGVVMSLLDKLMPASGDALGDDPK